MRLSYLFMGLALCACAPTSARGPAAALTPAATLLPTAPSLEDASSAIAAVLDDWHAAAAVADEARYFAHLTEDAIFMGTDASERWDKAAFLAFAHPYFSRGKAWNFSATRRAIMLSPGGHIAWFDEDLKTPNLGPARGSGVLKRGPNGRWLIAHYNLTITIPNERLDAVKALLDGSAQGPCPRRPACGAEPTAAPSSRSD